METSKVGKTMYFYFCYCDLFLCFVFDGKLIIPTETEKTDRMKTRPTTQKFQEQKDYDLVLL